MKAVPLIVGASIIITSLYFVGQGVSMHNSVAIEEAKFHALQTQYFTLAKAERESAPTGSALTAQLVEISNYPSELLRLKLVGVGKILTGIFVMLLGIFLALLVMPMRLAMLMKKNNA